LFNHIDVCYIPFVSNKVIAVFITSLVLVTLHVYRPKCKSWILSKTSVDLTMVSVLLSLIVMPFVAAFIGNGPSNHSILISPANCLSLCLKWQCILMESLMDGNCTGVIVKSTNFVNKETAAAYEDHHLR